MNSQAVRDLTHQSNRYRFDTNGYTEQENKEWEAKHHNKYSRSVPNTLRPDPKYCDIMKRVKREQSINEKLHREIRDIRIRLYEKDDEIAKVQRDRDHVAKSLMRVEIEQQAQRSQLVQNLGAWELPKSVPVQNPRANSRANVNVNTNANMNPHSANRNTNGGRDIRVRRVIVKEN